MDLPVHRSEKIEPAAAHFLGVQWKRCELLYKKWCDSGEYMDELAFDTAIERLWYGMDAFQRLQVACTGTAHMSVALGNEMINISRYIEERTGYSPILKEPKDHPLHITFSNM